MAVGPVAAQEAPSNASDAAQRFGAREMVIDISLSPDARHIVYVAPGPGKSTAVLVLDVASGETKVATAAKGDPLNFRSCGWASNVRIVCKLAGTTMLDDKRIG